MINQSNRRFTDVDVRNNDELIEIAYEYVEAYEGEFEFLISCKMRLQQGIDLSVGMVRGILNCMRVDPRVNMIIEDDEVVEVVVKKASNRRYVSEQPPEPERPHLTVVPPKPPVVTKATVKRGCVSSPNSYIYHFVDDAWVKWPTWGGPELYVKPLCYTHALKNPELLHLVQTELPKVVNGIPESMRLCKRCEEMSK